MMARTLMVQPRHKILWPHKGTMEGKRKRGRQRKRWTDSAEERTGKPLAETQALAHNHSRWRRLVHTLLGWRLNASATN